jgi:DNA modification methylase
VKPYYEHAGITIYHGDCLEVLPAIGHTIGAFVLADPPYGTGLSFDYNQRFSPANEKWWKNSDRSQAIRHAPLIGDNQPFDPSHLLGHPRLVLFGANHYASRLPDSGGWIVWDKRGGERDVSAAEWPMSEAELAWTNLSNGVRMFRHTWFGLIRDSEPKEHYHPTQKPVALMRWILEKWNRDRLLVLDPYCGSGPVLVAAKSLGMQAIGIEISEEYCARAARRLGQEVLDFGEVLA